jgi:hypothetical protein
MGNVTGALSKVIGWKEDTWNTTPATPDARRIPFVSCSLTDKSDREADSTLAGYRGMQRSTEGKADVGGSLTAVAAPEDIGFWLAQVIGMPTTTGASSPYTHSFAVDPTGAGALPAGIGMEVDYGPGISGAGRYMVYSGLRVNQFTMDIPANGNINLSIDLVGGSCDADNADTLDASPTDTGHNAWKAQKLVWQFGDGLDVCLESAKLTFGNDLDTERYCVGNDGNRHDLPEGQFMCSGEGVAYFDDAALLNKAATDTDASLVVTLTKGDGTGTASNESLVLTIPALVFSKQKPPIDGPKGLKLPFSFTTHRTTGEIGITAVLKNALAAVI